MSPMSGWLVLIIIVVLALALRAILKPRVVTVHDYEKGILFAGGRLRGELAPGWYFAVDPFRSIRVVDQRSRVLSIPGQEILSADNVSVKASVAIRLRVSDALKSLQGAQSFEEALYLEAQLILRDLISALPIEDLLAKRGELADKLRERLEPKTASLGVTLETVGIKDVMFPGGLKQIFAQVVEARKSAQAGLERARGETATLRSLANAARLLEGNPALVTLKTLQAAADGKHTLVLGLPQNSIIPIKESAPDERPPIPPPGEERKDEGAE